MSAQIRYVLCPGRDPAASHQKIYDQIYAVWKEVWSEALSELHGKSDLKADQFTRQDFIGALFVNDECKAMSLFRHVHARHQTFEDDSYFANWSAEHRQKLCSQGSRILVCSHFTIHASARKSQTGIPMRDLLTGLSMMVIKKSKADAMTGAMRKNRKVHQVTYDWGSEPVAADVPSGHGDFVDLIMMTQATAMEKHPLYPEVARLWQEKMVIPMQPLETVNDFIVATNQERKAA